MRAPARSIIQGFALGEVNRRRGPHNTRLDVHTIHVRVALIPIGGVACRHNIAPPFGLRREARAYVLLRAHVLLIGILVGELVQACAVGVDPVEVGVAGAAIPLDATLTLGHATEEHPVAIGRELWMILAVHLPGCDLMRILWRARRVEALDEHRRTVVSHANPLKDQHLPVGRESWPEVFKLQRSPLLDVANLVGIATVEPHDEDPLHSGTLIFRADDAPEGYRLTVG